MVPVLRRANSFALVSTLGCLGLLPSVPASAQNAPAPPPPAAPAAPPAASPAEVTAIVGGDLWTVTRGVIRGGTLILKGTKIDKVGGTGMAIPAGAKVVDAKGKVVTPGFVAAMASGAFVAPGSSRDGGKMKDGLDPYSLSVPLALASGVTTAYVADSTPVGPPGGGEAPRPPSPLGSSNAVIKMTDGDISAMLLKEPAMATFAVGGAGGQGFGGGGPGGATMSARWNLREQLGKARGYQREFEQYEKDKKAGKQVTEPKKPADADPVLPLIRGERVLRVTASEAADIRWALHLVDDFGIRIAVTPATEAWMLPDEIAKRGVPLIIVARSPERPDDRKNAPSGANRDAPGILGKAGVRFAVIPPSTLFSTGGMAGRDMLTYPLEAAFAVRGGLDERSALEAITIVPAEILGVADRVGSLEEGKDADVLILDGDPLDYRTLVEKTYVNGKLRYDKDTSPFFAHIKRPAAPEGAGAGAR